MRYSNIMDKIRLFSTHSFLVISIISHKHDITICFCPSHIYKALALLFFTRDDKDKSNHSRIAQYFVLSSLACKTLVFFPILRMELMLLTMSSYDNFMWANYSFIELNFYNTNNHIRSTKYHSKGALFAEKLG